MSLSQSITLGANIFYKNAQYLMGYYNFIKNFDEPG